MNKEKKLIILRSIPGGGKSTLKASLKQEARSQGLSVRSHSTDDFFIVIGPEKDEYKFDASKLYYYHKLNLQNATNSMLLGINRVIIDNTNTTFEECKNYILVALALGYEIEFVEPETEWRYDVEECFKKNTHGVPKENIQRMKNRWEDTELCIYKLEILRFCIGELKSIKSVPE